MLPVRPRIRVSVHGHAQTTRKPSQSLPSGGHWSWGINNHAGGPRNSAYKYACAASGCWVLYPTRNPYASTSRPTSMYDGERP